jgi:hypothetical protein
MPLPLRREVPDDENPVPTPALTRFRDPSWLTVAEPPRPRDPADHPFAVAAGTVLALLGGVTGLVTILLVLAAIGFRNEPEGTTSFAMAYFSLPAAATTTVLTAAASVAYQLSGLTRRAVALGIVAGVCVAAGCGWLCLLV